MLIPTKTGKEPAKKLYPKEPNPEMRGMAMMGPPHPQQVVQVPHGQPRFLAFPGGHHVSVGSAPMAFSPAGAGQPLSLPVIPVMSAAPVAFARYPPDSVGGGIGGDPNNNLHHQLMQMQWAAAAAAAGRPAGSAAMSAAQVQQAVAAAAAAAQHQQQQQQQSQGGGGRGRSRDRPRLDPEQRRRAQSKSPARAAQQESSSQNPGISRKFREFSDAVRQRMGGGGGGKGKSHSHLDVVDFSRGPASCSGPLKSNLKKNLSSEGDQLTRIESADLSDSNDNRKGRGKVHFNKFATVQMME